MPSEIDFLEVIAGDLKTENPGVSSSGLTLTELSRSLLGEAAALDERTRDLLKRGEGGIIPREDAVRLARIRVLMEVGIGFYSREELFRRLAAVSNETNDIPSITYGGA